MAHEGGWSTTPHVSSAGQEELGQGLKQGWSRLKGLLGEGQLGLVPRGDVEAAEIKP